jgi:hypothetical protein
MCWIAGGSESISNTFLPLMGKSSPSLHFRMMTEMEAIRLGRRRTLGHLVQHQLTLWMHCRKCRCAAKLDVQRLIQSHGAEMVLKALQLSWVCEQCGAGWPDVHVQVPPRPKRRAPPDDLSGAHF